MRKIDIKTILLIIIILLLSVQNYFLYKSFKELYSTEFNTDRIYYYIEKIESEIKNIKMYIF